MLSSKENRQLVRILSSWEEDRPGKDQPFPGVVRSIADTLGTYHMFLGHFSVGDPLKNKHFGLARDYLLLAKGIDEDEEVDRTGRAADEHLGLLRELELWHS